jgi:hypothetical protein
MAGHGGTKDRVSIRRAGPIAGPPHNPGANPVPNTIALEEQKQQAEEGLRRAAEPPLAPEQARLQQERDRLYEEHKKEIDRALALCTGHLKKLGTAVAREAIRRLEAYYLLHGIR